MAADENAPGRGVPDQRVDLFFDKSGGPPAELREGFRDLFPGLVLQQTDFEVISGRIDFKIAEGAGGIAGHFLDGPAFEGAEIQFPEMLISLGLLIRASQAGRGQGPGEGTGKDAVKEDAQPDQLDAGFPGHFLAQLIQGYIGTALDLMPGVPFGGSVPEKIYFHD